MEFGCEWMQKCLLCVQGGWLGVCLPGGGTESVEVCVVGPVWMGVKKGVQAQQSGC